ncbi:uncharacterized protein N7525_005094 [Penicillium rubens]|uniref:uncharacterized protein n=1 Tax=Penicillium rubens TaxID=1108849 RepID=UPI002A5A898D|nr:uncharacterized protein N7525_005094 [Penicillium rubens]KAJ5839906.1 hypothetical protein N7525_005094 [Penicillium rubens]
MTLRVPGGGRSMPIHRKIRKKLLLSSRPSLYEEDEMTRVTQPKGRVLLGYMVTTSLPYLDIESGVTQIGVCCSGCQIALEKDLGSSRVQSNACVLRDKVYSYDEFIEHLRECRGARNLWKLGSQGVELTSPISRNSSSVEDTS